MEKFYKCNSKSCTRGLLSQNEFYVYKHNIRDNFCKICRLAYKKNYLLTNKTKVELSKQKGTLSELSEESLQKFKNEFWGKVNIAPKEDCWLWQGMHYREILLIFYFKGKRYSAKRLAYIFSKGDIENNFKVVNICGNFYCCNPDHLIAGKNVHLHLQSPIDRFLKLIHPQENGCIYWVGDFNKVGYGFFSTQKEDGTPYHAMAHRWYYEYIKGPVPKNLYLDHLCRTPRCVNPEHLEPVTPKENIRRGAAATKTHCKNGHLFDEENTIITKEGRRKCKKCNKENHKRGTLKRRKLKQERVEADRKQSEEIWEAVWIDLRAGDSLGRCEQPCRCCGKFAA